MSGLWFVRRLQDEQLVYYKKCPLIAMLCVVMVLACLSVRVLCCSADLYMLEKTRPQWCHNANNTALLYLAPLSNTPRKNLNLPHRQIYKSPRSIPSAPMIGTRALPISSPRSLAAVA